MKIALIPNDDGLGPSALGYHLAKAFLNRGHSLIVRNKSALKSNQSFHSREIEEGRVSIDPVYGGIKLVKTQDGGVDLEKSFQNLREYCPRLLS